MAVDRNYSTAYEELDAFRSGPYAGLLELGTETVSGEE